MLLFSLFNNYTRHSAFLFVSGGQYENSLSFVKDILKILVFFLTSTCNLMNYLHFNACITDKVQQKTNLHISCLVLFHLINLSVVINFITRFRVLLLALEWRIYWKI